MIAEFRVVDVRLELISGASINGSGFLIDSQTLLTAAHVLSALADGRVDSVEVRTVFGSAPSLTLDPDRLSFARLGDPDPDRDGQAGVDAITKDLAVIQSLELPFSFGALPRADYDTAFPATRFVLDGFSPRPAFEVSSGSLSRDTDGLWRFDEALVAAPGDSGSVLLSISNEGSHAIGVTSTTLYAVALDAAAWAWVDSVDSVGSVSESVEPSISAVGGFSGAGYFFRPTVGDDVLIRHTDTGTFFGGVGYDRAIIDGAVERVEVDTVSGDFELQFASGENMRLIGFEQVLTPTARYYSTNDPLYSNLYRVITVLEGQDAAALWAPQARYWFADTLDETALVDTVLTLLNYRDPSAPADDQFINSVAGHLDLASQPDDEVQGLLEWAQSQSYRGVTLGAVSVADQFLGLDFG